MAATAAYAAGREQGAGRRPRLANEADAPFSSPSYALDDLLAEEALGAEQQEDEGDDVGEPVFDGAADEGAPVDLAEFLAHAHDEAADDGARHRREAAQDQHRQGLEGDQREAELHAALGAPHDAGHDGDEAGHRPHDDPDGLERDADRQRGLAVARRRAHRAPDPRALKAHL